MCDFGIASLTAKRSAVIPVVVRANIVRGGIQQAFWFDRRIPPWQQTLARAAGGSGLPRLLRWQPAWHARVKYLERLKHGSSLKKKIAVALARQLAIDLWRWRTGRASAADLGWKPATISPQLGVG